MSKVEEITPGRAQELRRISTEEVKRDLDVIEALARYHRHQKRKGFCECEHCIKVRRGVDREFESRGAAYERDGTSPLPGDPHQESP